MAKSLMQELGLAPKKRRPAKGRPSNSHFSGLGLAGFKVARADWKSSTRASRKAFRSDFRKRTGGKPKWNQGWW